MYSPDDRNKTQEMHDATIASSANACDKPSALRISTLCRCACSLQCKGCDMTDCGRKVFIRTGAAPIVLGTLLKRGLQGQRSVLLRHIAPMLALKQIRALQPFPEEVHQRELAELLGV